MHRTPCLGSPELWLQERKSCQGSTSLERRVEPHNFPPNLLTRLPTQRILAECPSSDSEVLGALEEAGADDDLVAENGLVVV